MVVEHMLCPAAEAMLRPSESHFEHKRVLEPTQTILLLFLLV